MNKLKLITLALLLTAIRLAAASDQPKGGIINDLTCWRLVNGPERGLVLYGSGRSISDFEIGAFGVIEDPDKCRCVHYHGLLFGENEPKNSCGWGCVIRVPCPPESPSQAASDLAEVIDYISNEVDGDLGEKLGDIYNAMESAAASGCYGVVDALADAFSEELQSYFVSFGYSALFDPFVQDLAEYVNAKLNSISPAPIFPVIAPRTLKIMTRIGTGVRGRLMEAAPRINLRVGEMLTLQMLAEAGLVNPLFLWQYKWSGRQEGEIPSAAAVAVLANYITLVSYANASLRLTGLVRTSSGDFYRDTILVRWNDTLY